MSIHLEVRDGKLVRTQKLPLVGAAVPLPLPAGSRPNAERGERCNWPFFISAAFLTLCAVVFLLLLVALGRLQENVTWAEAHFKDAHLVETAVDLLKDAHVAMHNLRAASDAGGAAAAGGVATALHSLNETDALVSRLNQMMKHPTISVSLN
jgi:hypothetical protein